MNMKRQAEREPSEVMSSGKSSTLRQTRNTAIAPKIAAQRQKNEAARRLLQEWLADESGYDETVWPQVKQIIEENRLSPRKRFRD